MDIQAVQVNISLGRFFVLWKKLVDSKYLTVYYNEYIAVIGIVIRLQVLQTKKLKYTYK